ncbi:tachylectin-related carbohydrate-binding protein [Kribbella sp. NPDC006257]|uniref:tachylectin-related carbohydrate-binding protein n=1 Tax=Kribbella sp. NPDC006257 TaxID=3156738 RepID=UPI0033B9B19A
MLTAGLTAGLLGAVGPTTAQAEDADITCTPSQSIFATKPNGELWLYQFNDLSDSNASPVWNAPPKLLGNGWDTFNKLLAGPDGWIYGIRAAANNGGGLFAYHWNGTKFDVAAKPLGGIFNGWAEPSRLNKITIDARGDFFLIQDNGGLRRYVLDSATNTFSSQPLGTGWNVFDSITATGDGVIHARKPAGTLTRYQFEKTSDRFIHVVQDGASGWQNYPKPPVRRWRHHPRRRCEWPTRAVQVQA